MHTKKYILSSLLFVATAFGFAQQIVLEDVTYEVKNEIILKEGVDVTNELTEEQKMQIFSKKSEIQQIEVEKAKQLEALEKEKQQAIKRAEKEEKERQKALKKQEKELKKAVKKQKQLEKALKKKEKAQNRLAKAKDKLARSEAKYEKLKKRGKLSPKDEAKWLKRIEGYNEDVRKANRNLSRS